MIQILLADDHPSVMEGTKLLIEQEGDMKVSLASSAEEALELARTMKFDVMLFDMHMPTINGIDLAKQVISSVPSAKILIYTGFEFMHHFNLIIDAGISGFVSKTATKEQLVAAIRCTLRDEMILPLFLAKQLRRINTNATEDEIEIKNQAINNKEYEILKEIAKGRTNKEIAETMIMSQRTLEYGLTNLFQKLHVKSRLDAVLKAKQLGILTPDHNM